MIIRICEVLLFVPLKSKNTKKGESLKYDFFKFNNLLKCYGYINMFIIGCINLTSRDVHT